MSINKELASVDPVGFLKSLQTRFEAPDDMTPGGQWVEMHTNLALIAVLFEKELIERGYAPNVAEVMTNGLSMGLVALTGYAEAQDLPSII